MNDAAFCDLLAGRFNNEYPQHSRCYSGVLIHIVSDFRRFRKIPLCPPVHPHGTTGLPLDGFSEIWYLSIFRKYFEKRQVSLKYDKSNGYFTWRPIYIFYILRAIPRRMRNVSDRCREVKTLILCSVTFLIILPLIKYLKKLCRGGQATNDNTLWCICISCWLHKATNTYLVRIVGIAFPLQQWLHEHASVLKSYTYIACLVNWYIFVSLLRGMPPSLICLFLKFLTISHAHR